MNSFGFKYPPARALILKSVLKVMLLHFEENYTTKDFFLE